MSEARATVQCVECEHFRLKDAGGMAKFGFGLCAQSSSQSSFPSSVYPRQCTKFAQAAADVRGARMSWLNKRGEG